MAVKYSASLKNARLDQITSKLGASCLIRIYDGTQPANPDTAITSQNLLSTLTGNAGAFAAASSAGVLTSNAITNDASAAGGANPAAWARLLTSGGTAHVDGSVSASGGGGDFIINNTSITAGQVVSANPIVVTAGN